jgi:hypothetical protein
MISYKVVLFLAIVHLFEFFGKYGVFQRDKRRSMLTHFICTMLFGILYWKSIESAQKKADESSAPSVEKKQGKKQR